MCFLIDSENPKPLIAQKDIKCYKEVVIPWYSYLIIFIPYFCKVYSYYIDGFVYRKNIKQAKISLLPTSQRWSTGLIINEGYHSNIKKRKHHNGLFIIPKGTIYYKNSEGNEYVSSTIIFKKILL